LLPVQIAEERAVATEPIAAVVPCSGSIHIELPGHIRVCLEGNVDAAMVRAVLKGLRS
jgi:hypothetical protein